VRAILVTPDSSRIIVGGAFAGVDERRRDCIAQLNPDGSLGESAFRVQQVSVQGINDGSKAITMLQFMPDGKILKNGTRIGGLQILNLDGTVHSSINSGVNGDILAVALKSNGRMLVGGSFESFGEVKQHNLMSATDYRTMRQRIARLDPADGVLEYGFKPAANDTVRCFALQKDGRILVGGDFKTLCGKPRLCLGRLDDNGGLDASFAVDAGPEDWTKRLSITHLVTQPDGKVIVAGSFRSLGGAARCNLARLKAPF